MSVVNFLAKLLVTDEISYHTARTNIVLKFCRYSIFARIKTKLYNLECIVTCNWYGVCDEMPVNC